MGELILIVFYAGFVLVGLGMVLDRLDQILEAIRKVNDLDKKDAAP